MGEMLKFYTGEIAHTFNKNWVSPIQLRMGTENQLKNHGENMTHIPKIHELDLLPTNKVPTRVKGKKPSINYTKQNADLIRKVN